MATQEKKVENKSRIESAVDNGLYLAKKANDYVLDTTEQAFDLTFKIADKSLDITSKVVKRGLEITATQQDFAFELLNGAKKRIFKN